MDGCGLLRDQRRVLPPGHEQHRRHQTDSLGHGGRAAERDERLPVGIDEPVERSERREAGGLGAAGPVEHLPAFDTGDRRGEPDANLHVE
jgi:hypothetical protein